MEVKGEFIHKISGEDLMNVIKGYSDKKIDNNTIYGIGIISGVVISVLTRIWFMPIVPIWLKICLTILFLVSDFIVWMKYVNQDAPWTYDDAPAINKIISMKLTKPNKTYYAKHICKIQGEDYFAIYEDDEIKYIAIYEDKGVKIVNNVDCLGIVEVSQIKAVKEAIEAKTKEQKRLLHETLEAEALKE